MAASVMRALSNRLRASTLMVLTLLLMLASSNMANTAYAEHTMPNRYACLMKPVMMKPALMVAPLKNPPFAFVSTEQLIDWHYSMNAVLAKQ